MARGQSVGVEQGRKQTGIVSYVPLLACLFVSAFDCESAKLGMRRGADGEQPGGWPRGEKSRWTLQEGEWRGLGSSF